MRISKDTLLLSSIFFIPIISVVIGNINLAGANLQFILTFISMLIAIIYLIKWGQFNLNLYIFPLLFIVFITAPLFHGKFGLIQILYIFTPFLYYMCGLYSKFDSDFEIKIKDKLELVLLLLLLLNFIALFGDFTQINSRPVSIFISLIAVISLFILNDLKYKIIILFLFLFVLFSGARGALIAGIIPLVFLYVSSKISLRISTIIFFGILIAFLIFSEDFLSIIFSIDALRDRTFYDGIYNYEKILNFEFNSSGRDIAWPIYWEYISVRSENIFLTLLGEGPGKTSAIGLEKLGEKWAHPHNEFIRILIDYGVVGLFSFFIFWIANWYKLIKIADERAIRFFILILIFMLLISLTDNPLMYPLYFGNLILFLTGLSVSGKGLKF